ncbi:MAG: hypothetical protein R3C27_03145 [Hyphomonadaceae bacterium]
MAQQSFAGLAVLIALTFAIMALHGCASSEQQVRTPEFHGAQIGGDELRSRVPSED